MKKQINLKSILCLLLAVFMLLSLGACGKKSATILDDSDYGYEDEDYGYDDDDTVETDDAKDKTSTKVIKKQVGTKNADGFDPYAEKKDDVKGKTVKFLIDWTISKKSNAFEQNVIDNMKKDLGITLKPVTVSEDIYQQKLTSMIASGDSPDMCIMLSTDFPMMIMKNNLQKIDTNIIDVKGDKELSISTMDLFKWDGNYYGINCGGNWQGGPFFVYYNATLIKQKGLKTPLQLYNENKWNWDTFAELAKNMTDKNKGYYGFGCESSCQVAFLDSAKTDFVKISGKSIINNISDPNLTKALSFVSDLRENGYMDPSENGGDVNTRAMTIRGSWLLQKQYYDNCYGDNGECVPVPCPAGQEQVIACQPRVICICRGAKQPVAATYAARYFCDPDNYDMTSEIKSKQMRDMFYTASKSNKTYGSVGVGVVQYGGAQEYWNLLYLTKYTSDKISVELQKHTGSIDGIIKKIQSDSAVFN